MKKQEIQKQGFLVHIRKENVCTNKSCFFNTKIGDDKIKGLTKKQKMTADALTNISYEGTLEDICQDFSISKDTLYQWLAEEEFRSYMDLILSGKTLSAMTSVWKSLLNQCAEGNIQAIKLYFELKGKYKGEKSSVKADNRVIEIIDDIPKGDKDGKAQ